MATLPRRDEDNFDIIAPFLRAVMENSLALDMMVYISLDLYETSKDTTVKSLLSNGHGGRLFLPAGLGCTVLCGACLQLLLLPDKTLAGRRHFLPSENQNVWPSTDKILLHL